VVASKVADEVRGTDDQRSIMSELHASTVAADRDTSPVAVAR
jgi:hypothetical protein